MQVHTWAWLPPFPVPLPPPLLPPPLPCLCCWDPVISAILLSICSRRSRMDILNWLSRAEQGRVRSCSRRRAVDMRPSQACRTAVSLTESQRFVQARFLWRSSEFWCHTTLAASTVDQNSLLKEQKIPFCQSPSFMFLAPDFLAKFPNWSLREIWYVSP